MSQILDRVHHDLLLHRDEKTRKAGKTFFKEAIKLYGVKTAIVSKIGKEHFREVQNLGKKQIYALCEELWKSGYLEESFIACNWSYYIRKLYEPADLKIFQGWIERFVANWASCDTLCNHTVGTFLDMYPERVADLITWTKSDNRWMRRASAVSLIMPARHGEFLSEIFTIADRLLLDRDDLVQKGYGWMLKSASQAHQMEVFKYVMMNKAIMPRTALRYAIEKMPKDMKSKAMEK